MIQLVELHNESHLKNAKADQEEWPLSDQSNDDGTNRCNRGANDDGQADLAYVYEQLRMHAFHLQDLGKANDDDATHVLFGDVIDRVLRNGKLSGRLKHVTVQVFGVDGHVELVDVPEFRAAVAATEDADR